VSSQQNRRTPAPVRRDELCMCGHGGVCSSFEPGHAVHLIQARVVASTPSEWVDAIVTAGSDADGTLLLHTLADGTAISLWNGAGAAAAAPVGTPVAYHPRYHTLSAGGRLFNALSL
jgi:hypothetical protein